MKYKILVINPGSTSTKIAVYEDSTPVFVDTVRHTVEEIERFDRVTDQYEYRKDLILRCLQDNGIALEFDAVIGRGGLAKPVEGGVYEVSDEMVEAMRNAEHQHACDLGCILAKDISDRIEGCRSFMADPASVDELNDYARISGSPHTPRVSIWHALNQRAVARKYAKSIGRRYSDLNLIVCHLGGGISVAAHEHGRAVDVNNALDGDGPFSPERAGSLPAGALVKLCFSGRYTESQLLKRIAGHAGLAAHVGSNDMLDVEQRIAAGDEKCRLIVDAMIYHTAKEIASQSAVLFGNIDAILITGGIAKSEYFIDRLLPRIDFLAPIHIFPGENEMEALAGNALAVLSGETMPKDF